MSAGDLFTSNAGRGRRFILEAVEDSEGTAESMNADNWQDYSECRVTPTSTYEAHTPIHGFRPGSKGTMVSAQMEVSRSRKIRCRAVTAGDGTDAPNFDSQARSGGAVRTDVTSAQYAYSWGVEQGGSCTTEEQHNSASGSDRTTTTAVGVRTNTVFSVASGGTWMLSGDGLGVPATPDDGREPQVGGFSGTTIADPFGPPIPAKGTLFRIYDIDNATMLTGGSLGTPGTTPAIISVEYDDQATITLRDSAQAGSGVAGTIRDPGEGQMTIVMERGGYDDWNPHASYASGNAIEVYGQRATGIADTNVAFLFCGKISQQPTDEEISEGRYITTLVLTGLHQPGDSDTPAAGTSPANGPSVWTNRGAPFVPVSGLPAGPFHLFVWTV